MTLYAQCASGGGGADWLGFFVTPGMSEASYPFVLTQGGDDRLVLNGKGVNKYHCRPEVSKNSREGAASLPPKPGVRMLEEGVNFAPCARMKKHSAGAGVLQPRGGWTCVCARVPWRQSWW